MVNWHFSPILQTLCGPMKKLVCIFITFWYSWSFVTILFEAHFVDIFWEVHIRRNFNYNSTYINAIFQIPGRIVTNKVTKPPTLKEKQTLWKQENHVCVLKFRWEMYIKGFCRKRIDFCLGGHMSASRIWWLKKSPTSDNHAK